MPHSESKRALDGIPNVLCEELLLEPEHIGHGGNKGSAVYKAHHKENVFAFKQYSRYNPLRASELDFVRAVHVQSQSLRCLVLPQCVVIADNIICGLLMPLYDTSLRDLLRDNLLDSRSSSITDANFPQAYRCERSFEPIGDIKALVGILYQVVAAVYCLHSFGHTSFSLTCHGSNSTPLSPTSVSTPLSVCPTQPDSQGVNCCGFSHNDVKADNILLKFDGSVALCDFELVGHFFKKSANCETIEHAMAFAARAPQAYCAPEGAFVPKFDEWCLGLLAVELATGIQPLLNVDAVHNNFGDGPLLCPANEANGTPYVDWACNLAAHVEQFLVPVLDDVSRAGLLDFCSKCLTNDASKRCDVSQLISHPLFEMLGASSSSPSLASFCRVMDQRISQAAQNVSCWMRELASKQMNQ